MDQINIYNGSMCSDFNDQVLSNIDNLSCQYMNPEQAVHLMNTNMMFVVAYSLIPILLIVILVMFWESFSVVFKSVLIQFIMFVFLCGLTHYMKIHNFWYGDFALEIIINYIGGIVSLITALTLLIVAIFLFIRLKKNPIVGSQLRDVLVLVGAISLSEKTRSRDETNKKWSMKESKDMQFVDLGNYELNVKHQLKEGVIILIKEYDFKKGYFKLICWLDGFLEDHFHSDYDERFKSIKGALACDIDPMIIINEGEEHIFKSGVRHQPRGFENISIIEGFRKI